MGESENFKIVLYKLSKCKISEVTEMGEVYIGKKPIMNYVLAVITQFNSGEKEVSIKARGKSISRAVDVAEILRNKLLQGVQVKEVKIGTEEISGQEGNTLNVSTIEIVLEKP